MLLPVILAIALVAAIVFTLNHQAVNNLALLDNELDGMRAEYVAQAGLQHALWQIAQQGCGPYTDLTDAPIGNDRYSTSLTTTLGATTAYTVPVEQDGWIRDDLTDATHPSDTTLHFRSDGTTARPVFRFDLSMIPAQASILSAVAYFYVTREHPEGPIDIHALNRDWAEADADWDLLGGAMDAKVQATIPAQPVAAVWIAVNLTPQVQAWVNGQSNFGITLNSVGDGANGDYASRETMFAPHIEVIIGTLPSATAQLTAVGTLANAVARTITRDGITLMQRPSSYLHMQPDASKGVDTYVYEWKSTWNYGASDEIFVSNRFLDSEAHGLVKFDLNGIPFGAKIKHATLRMFQRSPASIGGEIGVHRIGRGWDEGGQSGGNGAGTNWIVADSTRDWDRPGGDYDATPASTQTLAPGSVAHYQWDVTALVQGWASGQYANQGLALVPAAPLAEAYFSSSDNVRAGERPQLEITYTCTCGQACIAPQGAGNVALIGSNVAVPDKRVLERKALFESWGYTVDIFKDSEIGAIDTGHYDVVYVSEIVSGSSIGNQLTDLAIGVVNEKPLIFDELGASTSYEEWVGSVIEITDNSNYITAPFAAGSLPIYTKGMEVLTLAPLLAPDLQILAEFYGSGTLSVLDMGAQLNSGEHAAGRRVLLPLGKQTDSNFNWGYLDNNGRLLVQRAIEWAASTAATGDYYLDEFPDFTCGGSDEYTGSNGTLDWSAFSWTEIGDDGKACGADFRVMDDPDFADPSGNRLRLRNKNRAIERQLDLGAFNTAVFTFDYRRDAMAGGASVAVLASGDGGSSWFMLDTLPAGDDTAYRSACFDISTYRASNTKIRFAVNNGFNGAAYIDNVKIANDGSGCGGP